MRKITPTLMIFSSQPRHVALLLLEYSIVKSSNDLSFPLRLVAFLAEPFCFELLPLLLPDGVAGPENA